MAAPTAAADDDEDFAGFQGAAPVTQPSPPTALAAASAASNKPSSSQAAVFVPLTPFLKEPNTSAFSGSPARAASSASINISSSLSGGTISQPSSAPSSASSVIDFTKSAAASAASENAATPAFASAPPATAAAASADPFLSFSFPDPVAVSVATKEDKPLLAPAPVATSNPSAVMLSSAAAPASTPPAAPPVTAAPAPAAAVVDDDDWGDFEAPPSAPAAGVPVAAVINSLPLLPSPSSLSSSFAAAPSLSGSFSAPLASAASAASAAVTPSLFAFGSAAVPTVANGMSSLTGQSLFSIAASLPISFASRSSVDSLAPVSATTSLSSSPTHTQPISSTVTEPADIVTGKPLPPAPLPVSPLVEHAANDCAADSLPEVLAYLVTHWRLEEAVACHAAVRALADLPALQAAYAAAKEDDRLEEALALRKQIDALKKTTSPSPEQLVAWRRGAVMLGPDAMVRRLEHAAMSAAQLSHFRSEHAAVFAADFLASAKQDPGRALNLYGPAVAHMESLLAPAADPVRVLQLCKQQLAAGVEFARKVRSRSQEADEPAVRQLVFAAPKAADYFRGKCFLLLLPPPVYLTYLRAQPWKKFITSRAACWSSSIRAQK